MTISNTPNKSGPYFTDGVATAFPFEFKALEASDVAVYRTVNGVGTLLSYPTDYGLSGLGNDNGGTVTTTAVYPNDGGQIDIIPATPFVQPTSLPNQGAYFAKTVEGALDRVVMMVKRLSEQMDRALRLPVGSAIYGEDAIAELLARGAAAEAAATLAERWASDPVDAAVTPGKYSSYHWAYKAALSAAAAATFDPAGYYDKTAADGRYARATRQIVGGGLATGGGALDSDQTITVAAADGIDLRGGSDNSKALTSKTAADAMAWVALTDAATIAVDHAAGVNRSVTIAGTRAVGTPTNALPGWPLNIRVKQDATGGRTLTWAAEFDFGDGAAPVLSTAANAEDLVMFMCLTATKFAYLGTRKRVD